MSKISLQLPASKYKDSYIAAVREFQEENNHRASNYLSLDVLELEKDFGAYVQKLHDQSRGVNLPEGYISATEFWIIDEEDTYLGRVHIRHQLNEYLRIAGGHIGYNIVPSQRGKGYGSKALELGLVKAKELGLKEVLITCDNDNIPSLKIIEKHGGKLENKVEVEGSLKRRYWIDLE